MTTKDKVWTFALQQNMFQQGDHVLVGLSGGADSVCLMDLLLSYAKELDLMVSAVHVEHGIRGEEAIHDMNFVTTLCEKRGVACYVKHFDVPTLAKEAGMSEEEMGRKLRYEVFEQLAEELGANKIAVAHHENDVVETMLFNLCRGTGLNGLCALTPIRGKIVRPLLSLSREEIEEYLEKEGLVYCMDSTNEDICYSRNFIRKEIVPRLEQINPKAVSHMANTSRMLGDVRAAMDDEVDIYIERFVVFKEGNAFIKDELFKERESYVISRVVHEVVGELAGSKKDIQAIHLRQVEDLFGMQAGKTVDLPYAICAIREYDGIRLKRKDLAENTPENVVVCLQIPGVTKLPNGQVVECKCFSAKEVEDFQKIPDKKYTKWFDYDKIKGSLTFRYRKTGDYMIVREDGSRKKLKDLFIDTKIVREKRQEVLLLTREDLVLWAVGVRMGEFGKITEQTKNILEITLCGGQQDE